MPEVFICEGKCAEEEKYDLARRCCALKICSLWRESPESTLVACRYRSGPEYEAEIRTQVEKWQAGGWPVFKVPEHARHHQRAKARKQARGKAAA